jgi:hypothetical protein
MLRQLQDDEIAGTIRNGFRPFRCVVEFHDYNAEIGFRVYDPSDEPLGTFEGNRTSDLRDKVNLGQLIRDARDHISRTKGVTFSPPGK